MTNFVLCIHVQIRFASTEKNYSHRLACILFSMLYLSSQSTGVSPQIRVLFLSCGYLLHAPISPLSSALLNRLLSENRNN